MKTITLKQLCDEININFVEIVKEKRELKENEYYALVVTDNNNGLSSPHVRGIEPTIHEYIVGIEKSSGVGNWYISKEFNKRKNTLRGFTIVVEVYNTINFSIL